MAVTPDGAEHEAEFDFITDQDLGAVLIPSLAEKMGDAAAGGFELRVYGAGWYAFGLDVSADGTLTNIDAEDYLPFEDWADEPTWYVVTDQNATVVESLVTEDGGVPAPVEAELVTAPQHGTVTIGATSFGYTPDQDFLGSDFYTVRMTSNGLTRVVTFLVDVQDLPGDSTPTPIDPVGDDEGETPAEPEVPAEPQAPAEDGGDHTVPETVETGQGSSWALAGAAAVGAGLLVRFRRAFGLACVGS